MDHDALMKTAVKVNSNIIIRNFILKQFFFCLGFFCLSAIEQKSGEERR